MRCFIAVSLPDNIHQELSQIQSQLKEIGADVKWVEPGNIHLTLKFLGEVEQTKIKIISQQLTELIGKFSAFEIVLGKLGAFPTLLNPRVIWIGISKNEDKINNIQKEVEEILQPLGFEKEARSFHSHLTLGRVRSKKNIQKFTGKLESFPLPQFKPVKIDKIILFQSILKPGGAEYTVIDKFGLKG